MLRWRMKVELLQRIRVVDSSEKRPRFRGGRELNSMTQILEGTIAGRIGHLRQFTEWIGYDSLQRGLESN